jgi:hypothetical protein
MRTHFLKELSIPGKDIATRALPSFDFYCLGEVRHLAISCNPDEATSADLHLTALYNCLNSGRTFEITIKFTGTRRIKLPEFSPLFYLSELEIEDISKNQMEGIRYQAKCYGNPEFDVLSRDLHIVTVTPL